MEIAQKSYLQTGFSTQFLRQMAQKIDLTVSTLNETQVSVLDVG